MAGLSCLFLVCLSIGIKLDLLAHVGKRPSFKVASLSRDVEIFIFMRQTFGWIFPKGVCTDKM